MSTSTSRPNIIIIGGAEISITNRPQSQLQFGPENPGSISIDCNSKTWELVMDLASKECTIEFISVAGNDFPGNAMKAKLETIGVGVSNFHLIDGQDTAARHEILNLLDQPEMEFQNSDVFANMTKEMIQKAETRISSADCILLETCFPEEVISYVAATFSHIPILLLTDSEETVSKAKSILGQIKGILSGRRQAEILSGLSILSEEEMLAAGEWFFDKGIKQIFFDLGFGGVYYKDAYGAGVMRPGPARRANVVEGFIQKKPAEEIAAFSINREV